MKNHSILLLAMMVLWMGSAAEAKYSGGTGNPNDPYRIETPEDLNDIGSHEEDWNKHFILVNDVNLAQYTGTLFRIIGNTTTKFTGVFDGNDHKVRSFTWRSTGRNYIGLFGYVGSGGQIKNLGMENVDVNDVNGESVGGLVGYNYGGIITNCYSTGTVIGGGAVGGLVGRNMWDGTITDCYSTGSVSGYGGVGGLVGYDLSSTITNCYSTGGVSGTFSVGGLVGYNENSGITNCYSVGNVTGGSAVGGLVGLNMWDGTITDCYSTSNIMGTQSIGGLVGFNDYMGTITNCYSTGRVTGNSDIGGLVGYNDRGTITNCYSTGSITGDSDIGGLVGSEEGAVVNSFWDVETSGCSTSAGGTGKTTAEMKIKSTFTNAGWGGCGGNEIWTLDEGNDYPRLAWEGKPGQPLPKQELSDFLEGSGTDTDPYLIYTAEQLNLIGLFLCEWDKDFMLAADINISDYSGTRFNIIGILNYPFTGVFDGNDRKIWNFTWTSDSVDYVGLFGCVGRSGQIKNLGLEKVSVSATNAYCVGGLVGWNYQGTITNCYSTGTVSGRRCIGGLVGDNSGTIANCYSIANVLGDEWVGGLVGCNWWDGGRITNSYSSGSVSGNYEVGGLVGDSSSTIANCYSTGSISGVAYVGGLVGENFFGMIKDCYSTGSVSGNDRVGGLVGYNGGSITASLWDTQTSGQLTSGSGTGKTTAEMKTMSTFTDAGWDFVEVWGIGENQTYPFLLTDPAGDSNHDKKVDFADLAILASHWLEGPP